MHEYLIKFITRRVKNEYIRNKCIEEIKEGKRLTYVWDIITSYKFNRNQLQIISDYEFNCVKDFNCRYD